LVVFKTSIILVLGVEYLDMIVWQGEPAVLTSSSFTSGMAIVIASILSMILFPNEPLFWLQALGLGIAVLLMNFGYYHGRSSTYVVSERVVSTERHFIRAEYQEIPVDKISDVFVSQGAVGRIFNFGTVTVRSNSVSFQSVLLKGVKRPTDVKEIILETKMQRYQLTGKAGGESCETNL
jgi:uncharacterized membrane protein